ncbi:MAG: flagellar basal-body MS-ring/collar protein FliF [Hyphomicrobiales bacterium]|nr:flagellar basal-body MS-ring/collar protein FliF [Hyphomicrobiales bacterium]
MVGADQLQRIRDSVVGLGARRLMALAAVGASVFAAVVGGGYFMSKSEMDALYVGLTPQDVTRIGAALTEAGIRFDSNAEGTKVFVNRSQMVQARMALAEKGLPMSATAGYELFDKLGSMSLTSFMQNITRLRALEGEIARTVQAMKGVKAARVHIVLPDPGSFRRAAQPPSASVVIRQDPSQQAPSAAAIRHLVSAAIPGMALEQVSVLSTEGAILAAGGDGGQGASSKMLDLERSVAKELQDNIRKTLTPYLGHENFEVSVTARLNIDKRSTNETAYDPDSKVERSVRTVKESGASQNAQRNWTVSVEQNIPTDERSASGGEQSKRSNERREELTNFELATKTIATVSEGYRIEGLAIAVVVNRKRLEASGAVEAEVKKVEQLVASAAGVDVKRGDKMTVAAVAFHDEAAPAPAAATDWTERISGHASTLITAGMVLAVSAMLIWFVLRPALRTLAEPAPALSAAAPAPMLGGPALGAARDEMAAAQPRMAAAPTPAPPHAFQPVGVEQPAPAAAVPAEASAAKRLEALIENNEERAAAVLKQWIAG